MVVEVFTLHELVHNRLVCFDNAYINRTFTDFTLFRGDHVHVNGPCCMLFFDTLRASSIAAGKSCRHIHYSVSPNTEISTDADLAWGLMSLMPLLTCILSEPPDVLILSTDPFSTKYLEYTRKQLPEILASFQKARITIFSNIPVVQLSASHQINPTCP